MEFIENNNRSSRQQPNYQDFFEEKPVDLKPLLWKYVLGPWYFYVIGLVLACTVAWIYLRYAEREFQASTTILIRDEASGASGGLQESFVLEGIGLGGGGKNIENEIEILKSRSMMREVVDSLKLNIRYFAEGRIRTGEQYTGTAIYLDSFALSEGKSSGTFEVILEDSLHGTWTQSGDEEGIHFAIGETLLTPYGVFRIAHNARIKEVSDETIIIRISDAESEAQRLAGRVKIKRLGNFSSALDVTLTDGVPERACGYPQCTNRRIQ